MTGLTERRLARLAEWSAASGVHGCTATARTGWTSASAGKLRTGAAEGIARSRITRTTTDGLGGLNVDKRPLVGLFWRPL